ncbi:MAG: hypothetical protein GXO23_05095 [Crenarchaeota archaeon]|nr:hypothetical protein [Thermoproteota archaeon]
MRPPRLLKPIIDIAVPWNVLEECADDREKIRKIGYICRGAAIFQVSRLVIYRYGRVDERELRFLLRNLEYMTCPPYLRKDLFKIEPELKYAGLLPPLKTPCHYLASKDRFRPGDVVEGTVVRWDGYFSIVKIGENKFARIPRPYPVGSRLTIRIEAESREGRYRAHVVSLDKIGIYWNITVEDKHLRELLNTEEYSTVILTGREGRDIRELHKDLIREISRARELDKRILILFGSPRKGVDEILREENLDVEKYYHVNFIPEQGVETVRTEEAIIAVLSVMHFIRTCLVRQ